MKHATARRPAPCRRSAAAAGRPISDETPTATADADAIRAACDGAVAQPVLQEQGEDQRQRRDRTK